MMVFVQFLQVKPADDELAYVNVYFSKEPEEALYANMRPARASRHVKRKREEEMVEYSPLKLHSASSSPRLAVLHTASFIFELINILLEILSHFNVKRLVYLT